MLEIQKDLLKGSALKENILKKTNPTFKFVTLCQRRDTNVSFIKKIIIKRRRLKATPVSPRTYIFSVLLSDLN